MGARIGPDDVTVVLNVHDRVEAHVRGRNRMFVVDHHPAWSPDWLCSCGSPWTCPHVRAVKEALGVRDY